ncbi:hypothetical protein [Nocardiopsis coralliicola]
MPRTFCVYVGKDSTGNFTIGRSQQIWGWKPEALKKKVSGTRAEDTAASMQPGDTLLFGYSVHLGPRVPKGGLANAVFATAVATTITEPLYESSTPVWPDAVYDKRVRFSLVEEKDHVHASEFGPEIAEALRLSGIGQGLPVMIDQADGELTAALSTLDTLEAEYTEPEEQAAAAQSSPTASGHIKHTGAVDQAALTKARKEQKKLRNAKLGDAAIVTCALCGRALPRRMVRTAHVKARRYCITTEFLNLSNVMAACTLGCDELFEHGHVYVDEHGLVRTGPGAAATPDLQKAAETLAGRECAAFDKTNEDSRAFFRFHREQATGT